MNKKTNEYIKRAHEMACNHGFHDKELSIEHCLMLVITEISEMVEADRKGKYAQVAMYESQKNTPQSENLKEAHRKFCFETFIKDSFEDEMADVCIRLYDTAGTFGVTFEEDEMNLDMHKEYEEYFLPLSLTEKTFALCGVLLKALGCSRPKDIIGSSLYLIELIAEEMHIDLFWFIEQKMEYNETRKKLHGKKY